MTLYLFASQLAVYVLLLIEPLAMVTVIDFPLIPVPLQPVNVYPVLVGLLSVNVAVFMLNEVGLPETVAPDKPLYVIE